MTFQTTIELNNGVLIPQLGCGTALISEDYHKTVEIVSQAIDMGYRHFDTASIYYNEEAVGEAIRISGIPREEFFVTTKLWTTDMRAEREEEAFNESMKKLGMDYVDMYMIHWPVRGRYTESWKVLEKLYGQGRTRTIGVSNFNPHHIDDIIALGGVVPAVNQYQFHPQMSCPELRDYCRRNDIAFEACQPLGQGLYIDDPEICRIAEKYGKTAAQVVIRWDLQHGVITIPKSSKPDRVRENGDVFDFELSSEDMMILDSMNVNRNIVPDADPETFTF